MALRAKGFTRDGGVMVLHAENCGRSIVMEVNGVLREKEIANYEFFLKT